MEVEVFFGTVSVAGSAVTASPSKSKSAVASTGDKMLLADIFTRALLLLSRRLRRSVVRFGLTPALRPPVCGTCRALTPIANAINSARATMVHVRSDTRLRNDFLARRRDAPVSLCFIEFEDSRSE